MGDIQGGMFLNVYYHNSFGHFSCRFELCADDIFDLFEEFFNIKFVLYLLMLSLVQRDSRKTSHITYTQKMYYE